MSSEMTTRWAGREVEEDVARRSLDILLLDAGLWNPWGLTGIPSRTPHCVLLGTKWRITAWSEQWFWFRRSSGTEPKWGLFLSGPASKLPAPSVHPRHCGVVIAALSLEQILFLLIIFLTEILSHRMFLAGGSLSATGGAQTHVFCSRALARTGRPRTGSFPDTQEASKLALCGG